MYGMFVNGAVLRFSRCPLPPCGREHCSEQVQDTGRRHRFYLLALPARDLILFTTSFYFLLGLGFTFYRYFLVAGYSYSILILFIFYSAFHVTCGFILSVTFDEWYAPHLPNFPHMALVDPRNMVTALSQEHPALGLNPRPLGYETDALTTRPRCHAG